MSFLLRADHVIYASTIVAVLRLELALLRNHKNQIGLHKADTKIFIRSCYSSPDFHM